MASSTSRKRPGVDAAIRLAAIRDVNVWERVEQQYDLIRNQVLLEAETACSKSLLPVEQQRQQQQQQQQQQPNNSSSTCSATKKKRDTKDNNNTSSIITKDQLMDLVQWKFAVGKPRPQNLGLLRSNTNAQVVKASRTAIQMAMDINTTTTKSNKRGKKDTTAEILSLDASSNNNNNNNNNNSAAIKASLEALTKELKGVGPATASAILCRFRPDCFCYMYDEVIDCFEPKRTYTVNTYLRINTKCCQLAQTLGDGWTTARVAKVLWTAARVLANNNNNNNSNNGTDDLTQAATISSSGTSKEQNPCDGTSGTTQPKRPQRKRRKMK